MESLKKRWFNIPAAIRKPIVLVVGLLIVIASPFTGALPGPGGIPVFLIGVAILATEFEWAQRMRDWVLRILKMLVEWWRQHKLLGSLVIIVCTAIFIAVSLLVYRQVKQYL